VIRLGINGAMGRMGRAVGRLALEGGGFEIASAIDAASSKQDYGVILGRDPIGVKVTEKLAGRLDVLIDFSVPDASLARLGECVRNGTPHLVCTTGFDAAARKKIRDAGRKIPVLLASNTSIGVAALSECAGELARRLGPEFDIEIVEMHHRRKKDAPSGTAITLAESIARVTGRTYPKDFRFGRSGETGERTEQEIGIHALRGGGVVGEHTIVFASEDEVVTVSHRAASRDLFARGALRAARFLASAKAGCYSMTDVLAQPTTA